jgi:hypothetical protein
MLFKMTLEKLTLLKQGLVLVSVTSMRLTLSTKVLVSLVSFKITLSRLALFKQSAMLVSVTSTTLTLILSNYIEMTH